MKSLFTAPANFWDIVSPGIIQPIFQAGRLRAGVRVAEAVQQEALLTYKKSIQQTFQEVSDSLEICTYDEGFIAGLPLAYSGKDFHVKEVGCWGSGGRVPFHG